MELKGWEEIAQKVWATLPLQIRATVTYSGPYHVTYIAETAGLEKLKQEDAERTEPTAGETGSEGEAEGNSDNASQQQAEPKNA